MDTPQNNRLPTVLFVEDERLLQQAVSAAFTASGLAVSVATDGEEGLRRAQSSKPDVVLLDIILPKRDGFSVLAELKRSRELRRIPVIVLTNLESSADIRRARALGAAAYLIKANLTLSELVEHIKALLPLRPSAAAADI